MSKPFTGTYDDLPTRAATGAFLAIAGLGALYAGGVWIQALISLSVGLIVWEIWKMIDDTRAEAGAVLAVAAAALLPSGGAIGGVMLLFVPVVGALAIDRLKLTFFLYSFVVLIAGYALLHFRLAYGFPTVLWLVLVVMVSDLAGYFVGRAIGGRKFWPRISPKKTWSGTLAGWIGAALVGLGFVLFGGSPLGLIPLSVVLAFAGQLGDIAESALKRRVEVKDSSNLIPGHGGFYDRFDALLGAAFVLFVMSEATGLIGVFL